jgi:hypothetical protein
MLKNHRHIFTWPECFVPQPSPQKCDLYLCAKIQKRLDFYCKFFFLVDLQLFKFVALQHQTNSPLKIRLA